MTAPVTDPPRAAAASLRRRLACMVYEGMLLFGVVMIAGLLYAGVTQQRHALVGTHGLQAFMFLVIGLYFTWFWSQGRQTVAMKTWRLHLVTADGAPLSLARAFARYVASWLWFLPGLGAAALLDRHDGRTIGWALATGVVAYALLARVLPGRQCLHDLLCGTRLVQRLPARTGQNPAP